MRSDTQTDDIPVLCASCEARHRGICAALDAAQLIALARSSHKHRAGEGEELVGEEEHIESYSNVLSGVVKLTKTLSDGRQQIVGLRFPSDFLGLTIETVSRQFTRLGADGVISIENNRHVTVPSLSRLEARSGG